MNVDYPPEAETFRAQVRAFLHRVLPPDWRGLGSLSGEQARAFTKTWRATLAAEGYLTPSWPPEYGGAGLSRLQQVVLTEELATAGVPFNGANDNFSIKMIGNLLLRYGTQDQKSYFLPRIVSGEHRWCQGFSETEAGSDLAAMRTRAKRDGDGWVITGHKVWNSYASVSDRCVLLARTGEQSGRHRTISAFLVDMDTPGVQARPITTMTGRNELSEIYFDSVAIPADRLIGQENQGWAFAMFLMQWERGMYAWMRQAWCLHQLEMLRPYITDARFERDFGAAYGRVTALRMVARRTLRRLGEGDFVGPEVSVDKLLLSSSEQAVLNLARDVLRGRFELDDSPDMARWRGDYFYTRSSSIYGGAAEIQRDIVAQRVLGLPRARG